MARRKSRSRKKGGRGGSQASHLCSLSSPERIAVILGAISASSRFGDFSPDRMALALLLKTLIASLHFGGRHRVRAAVAK